MSASLTKLKAGTSTKYYTQTVEDVATDHGGGMASYYNTPGTPPGVWMGGGLDIIHREAGTTADKTDISRVYDNLSDPDTGRSLTRNARRNIEAGKAVAGYDLTFTLPKSVDILWAAGDPHVRRTIMRCHKEAVQESVDWFERHEAYSRTGEGGIVKQRAGGIIAADFTHWDSREGDPHLHDHVLISNIVKRGDGRTGALDGKALYSAAVAISERQTNLFMDKLTDSLGVQWRQREMPGTKSSVYDLVGIDDELIETFSQRTAEINKRIDQETAKLRAAGIEPDENTLRKLHRKAWRESRKAKPKEPRTLHELMDGWGEELARLGYDGQRIVRETTERGGLNMDVGALLDQPGIMDSAHRIIKQGPAGGTRQGPAGWLAGLLRDSVADTAALQSGQQDGRRADGAAPDPFESMHAETAYNTTTITENVIRASAERLTRGIRLRPGQRDRLTDMLVDEEKKNLVLLDPGKYRLDEGQRRDPELSSNGERAVTDNPEGNVYATKELLAAETRFKEAARNGIYMPPAGWDTATLQKAVQDTQTAKGYRHPLAEDQRKAVIGLLSSTKTVVGLAGPAGTGKTTTLRCLADVAAGEGNRKVVAFAPTAVAAQELGASLGVPADTLAKVLYEDDNGLLDSRIRAAMDEYRNSGPLTAEGMKGLTPRRVIRRYRRRERARQKLAGLQAEKANLTIPERGIVIVDEAGMANTFDLQHLSELCSARHAKMILVGDDKQLNTVGGGAGAFTWLTQQKDMVYTLDSIWRFKDPAEADRSTRLRSRTQDPDTKDYAALRAYDEEGRVHAGQSDRIEARLVDQVADDYDQGVNSLLIVGSNEGIADMNERISRRRQEAGTVEADPRRRVILADGSTAGRGDIICTRNNDRRIRTSQGRFVRNNDLWAVDEAGNGTIRCHPIGKEDDSVILPAGYVDRNVIGGYAVTPHRSQGKTVDRGYYYIPKDQAGVSSANTLYVAMTRGRERNDVYVATKDIQEMKVGTEDTYELAAWRQRNRTRYEQVEGKKHWDAEKGPKPGEGWYTDNDLLPTPHQQAIWTLHQVMDHTQTGQFASEWAQDYRQATYQYTRLEAEWRSYQRILSERQLGRVLDPGAMDRLKEDPGYRRMLSTYGEARERLSPNEANRIVGHAVNGSATDIRNLLDSRMGGRANGKPYHARIGSAAPEEEKRVADMMNQALSLMDDSSKLARRRLDWHWAFGEDPAPWVRTSLGPRPPAGSPRGRSYGRIVGEINEYRLIHRISDPQRAFGATEHADGWQREIRRRMADYLQEPRDADILDPGQDRPRGISHGRERAVKTGRDILLDYTDGPATGGKLRIPVDAETANGTVNRIRSIRADAPARITIKAGPDTDLEGAWRALTPTERGEVSVLGPDGQREPLWKGMADRSGDPDRYGTLLQGLDIEHRHQAEAWLKESPSSPASHGELYPAVSEPEPITPVTGSTDPSIPGPAGPGMA